MSLECGKSSSYESEVLSIEFTKKKIIQGILNSLFIKKNEKSQPHPHSQSQSNDNCIYNINKKILDTKNYLTNEK